MDYDKVLEKSTDCTKKITEAKNGYINKITDKLQTPSTAPKTYLAIQSRLLYKKNSSNIYHHFWLMANLFQVFMKKQIFSIIFFHQYAHQYKIQVFYHLFYIGQMPE